MWSHGRITFCGKCHRVVGIDLSYQKLVCLLRRGLHPHRNCLQSLWKLLHRQKMTYSALLAPEAWKGASTIPMPAMKTDDGALNTKPAVKQKATASPLLMTFP